MKKEDDKKYSIIELAGIITNKEGGKMIKKIKEERKIGSRRFK